VKAQIIQFCIQEKSKIYFEVKAGGCRSLFPWEREHQEQPFKPNSAICFLIFTMTPFFFFPWGLITSAHLTPGHVLHGTPAFIQQPYHAATRS
jgi:hypothetical protein